MTSSDSSQIFWNLANVDDENTLTFQIKDTEVAYVNTLRRMILTGVESLAFNSKMNETGKTTDVEIRENTTPMTNEMLADRIGLIPIVMNGTPESWDKNQFEFRLSMENNTDHTIPVKAEHIQVFQMGRADEGYIPYTPGNKEFFHPDPITGDTCLIAVLKAKQPNTAGQKIEFTARASIGIGQQHIRWCPVSQCSYSYTIDTDAARQQQFFERWLENNKKLSMDALKEDAQKKDQMIREFQTMEVQRCYKINEKGEPNSFDFVVESIGTMPIFDIVERALLNIEKKCAKYAGELPSDVRVMPADARMKGFDFYFPNEDHTLGNLLQAYMEANQLDTNEVSFAGYKVPHPLRAEMVLRVGVDFPMDKARDGKQTVARAAVSRAAAGCAMMFREWREDWVAAKTRPIGKRNRESLRLNVGNAKALEEAAARIVPPTGIKAPKDKRQPQKSAFYGKYKEQQQQPQTPPYEFAGQTPPYEFAGQTPNYSAFESPLPEGWSKIENKDQGTVYYASKYGTQWERPTQPAAPLTPQYTPSSPKYTANSPPYVPTSPQPTSPVIPAGWEVKRDKEGKVYYESKYMGTRYTVPTSPAYVPTSPIYEATSPQPYTPPAAPLPQGWYEGIANDGSTYYYTMSGRRQANRPTQPAPNNNNNTPPTPPF